ncbi:UNVERIFIED_CONTAM: hypothetical protein FKN15_012545 [Acipenser sinensis]
MLADLWSSECEIRDAACLPACLPASLTPSAGNKQNTRDAQDKCDPKGSVAQHTGPLRGLANERSSKSDEKNKSNCAPQIL